jgi:hypothetical protein
MFGRPTFDEGGLTESSFAPTQVGSTFVPLSRVEGQSHLSEIVEQAEARRQRLGSTFFSACVGFFLPVGMLVLLAAPFFVFIPRRLLWLRHDIEMVTFLAIVFLTLTGWRMWRRKRFEKA